MFCGDIYFYVNCYINSELAVLCAATEMIVSNISLPPNELPGEQSNALFNCTLGILIVLQEK